MEGLARRFLREIDLVKRLEHPNIVRLYDFGQTDNGLLWMAMELVRGPELAEVMGYEGKFDVERAQHIMLQTLSGLAEAHALDIVHRDMKPGNIMLTDKGADSDVVKLLDFGIGKALGEHEDATIQNVTGSHGDSFGTPRYMAPELLMKEEIGPHSDVYSAGLILYELVVGEAAVVGESVYEILARQLSNPLDIPGWLADSPLGDVIRKATEKDWRARYATALQFHQALKQLDLRPAVALMDMTQTQPALSQAYQQSSLPPAPHAYTFVPQLPMPAAPLPLPMPPSGPLPGFSAPAPPTPAAPAPAPERGPTEDELKSMLSTKSARKKQHFIIGAVALFLVSMIVAWVALSGDDDQPKGEESEAKPTPAETKSTEPEGPREMVTWAFKSTPPGLPVQVNGRQLCDHTPCVSDIIKQNKQVTVYFASPGYLSVSKTIIPTNHGELRVELIKLPEEPVENADVVDSAP
jgi:serine/threonine-protein kinase